MRAPAADRTAKRLSVEEWFSRYDASDLMKRSELPPQPLMRAPADRTAQRK
jgi:hypothetical protein